MDQPRNSGPVLNDAEYATIKAALLHWRNTPERPAELAYLAGNAGEITLLDTPAIDALIARLHDDFYLC